MNIKIAILLSGRYGRGSNMTAISRACADGRIHGNISLVVSNFEDSPALAQARQLGHATVALPSPPRGSSPADDEAYERSLYRILQDSDPDLICLAGYLRKLPARIVEHWEGRILNTHPALLPSFGGQGMYGAKVHQAVIDYGVKYSGCTVHFVDNSYDTGPIVAQVPVPVLDEDTADSLAARVLQAEHQAYPAAVALFSQKRIKIVGRRVNIMPSDT